MRIVVTGATGAIGRSVVRALMDAGHEGVAVDRDVSGRPWRLGSKADEGIVRHSAGLVHLAWDSDPASYEANVSGSMLLFDQARRAGLTRIVFVSSQSAGASKPTRYGSGKLAVERSLHQDRELAVRPGLVWSDPPRGTFEKVINSRILGRSVAARTGPVLHPVHLDDIAGILAKAVVSGHPCGVIEVGSIPPLSMQALVEVAVGEPVRFLLPVGALRIGGRMLLLSGARGRRVADRLLGLAELERMIDPQDGVLGVTCRPLRKLESTRAS